MTFSHRQLIDIAGVCAKIGRFVMVLVRYILLNLTETGVKCTVTHPNPVFSTFDKYDIFTCYHHGRPLSYHDLYM